MEDAFSLPMREPPAAMDPLIARKIHGNGFLSDIRYLKDIRHGRVQVEPSEIGRKIQHALFAQARHGELEQ